MASVTQNKDGNETMADDLPDPEDRAEKVPAPRRPEGGQPSTRKDEAGYFTIYKKGQGYWTRMGTAITGFVIIALTAHFAYRYLPPWITPMFTPADATVQQNQAAIATARNVTLGVCAAILAGFGMLAWRLMNKPGNVDFLIATDSEMKKVNWTSRKELIGSTKVVIIFMFLIAGILFLIDIIFGSFFHLIHVLDAGPFGN
ncbi:MAG: preprotein translocase subunit SecE [Tepidisphaeraceae bacterium]